MTGACPVNGLCTSILFVSGAERRFITSMFRKNLRHKSRNLYEPYIVQITNGESGRTQEILENCLLSLNNHSFHVNLMPITIGSFDVIISVDWLSLHQVEILCYDKVVQLPLANGESLIIYRDKINKGLRIISCMKAQKYLHKKYHTFMAQIIDKRDEKKEIKDIP